MIRIGMICSVLLIMGCSTMSADTLSPSTLNYQGRLTDSVGSPVADGTRTAVFRMFDDESSGVELWSESSSVTVTDGLINVVLGNTVPIALPFDRQYWLEVQIEDQVLHPRVRLTSAPYAMNASRLDGRQVSTLPEPEKLLALDSQGKFPNESLKTGHTRGLDADTLDGSHLRDIYSRTKARAPGISIEKYPFVDLNKESGDYTHITNGRVGVFLESGYGAVTWAMNSQTVVDGQMVHCIDWEPYSTAYGQHFGPYTGIPHPELAKHRNNNAGFTLLDRVRYYKDEASAMSGSTAGELNPLSINKDTEKVVFMHRHVLYPFRPVGDKYPAIQMISPTGRTVGWGSTNNPADYGEGIPDIADSVRCGWDGSSENLVGMVFEWEDDADRTDAIMAELKVYIHQVEGASSSWWLMATFFPGSAGKWGAARTVVSTALPEEGWATITIPTMCLRKGTNCVLLRTSGGSSTRYVVIGAGEVQTKLLKKNYMLTSWEAGHWDSLRRVSEYFVIHRDNDRIKTWAKVDSGSDVTLDFVGAPLGDHSRRTGSQQVAPNIDIASPEPFSRGIKRLVSPTQLENPNLGVKTINDPGYTPTTPGTTISLYTALDGLIGEDRYLTFSRDGAYRTKYLFEDPGGGVDARPRISSWNDFYAGGPGVDEFSTDPLGYRKSWTDAPCANAGLVPAGSRTCIITIDYSDF